MTKLFLSGKHVPSYLSSTESTRKAFSMANKTNKYVIIFFSVYSMINTIRAGSLDQHLKTVKTSKHNYIKKIDFFLYLTTVKKT